MKKLFRLFMVLVFVGLLSQQSQAQDGAVYVNGGYSWSKGVIGAEWKSGHWGLALGYMPTKMPMSGNPVASVSAAVSIYSIPQGDIDMFGWYGTLAAASAGYRMENSYGQSQVETMTILTGGLMMDIDLFYFSFGAGYGFYAGGSTPTLEVTLGIKIWEKW